MYLQRVENIEKMPHLNEGSSQINQRYISLINPDSTTYPNVGEPKMSRLVIKRYAYEQTCMSIKIGSCKQAFWQPTGLKSTQATGMRRLEAVG